MAEVKGSFFRPRKSCQYCANKVTEIDYKNIKALTRQITEQGRLIPARISANCAKHQRSVSRAIKRARFLALLPYVSTDE
ncbi:MAG: 30S ribosomal protein S18 [Lactobacillales bacterium]|jgi:small subunit ribosomal protein S18|nr:30S ribosomal protein S18 [Lactobacillales bacterium]